MPRNYIKGTGRNGKTVASQYTDDQRLDLMAQVKEIMSHGIRKRDACNRVGITMSLYTHWQSSVKRDAMDALMRERLANAMRFYDEGLALSDAARKAGCPESELILRLRNRSKPRHFAFS